MITVIASSPLVGNLKTSTYNMQRNIKSYQHEVRSFGGYTTASIDLTITDTEINEWVDTGLGRHITTYSEQGAIIWEGFINNVSINFGPLQLGIGPLTEIRNRVYAKYADFTTNVPTLTATAEDKNSQRMYGIRSGIISVGQVSSASAEKIRDTYLDERKRPKISQSVSGDSEISLKLDCVGYVEMLNFNYFNAGTSTYTLREKIIDILDSEPNTVFSTDYGAIKANTLSVFELENEGRKGLDIIKDLVNMGDDGTNAKAMFGVYENRRGKYTIDDGQVAYMMRLREGNIIRGITGNVLTIHDIKPGKWLQFSDLRPSTYFVPGVINNPGLMFVEGVSFTAPDKIALTAGDAASLPQRLAKLGLAGIS